MLKKIIAISTLLLFIYSNAIASPLFNILNPNKTKQPHHLMNKNKIAVQSGVDFSGNWKGQCFYENEQLPISLKIVHMGSIVQITGADFEGENDTVQIIIGNFENESKSGDLSNLLNNYFAYWDRSNTKLIVEDVQIQRSSSLEQMTWSWTVVSRSIMDLTNNHLNINTTTTIFDDGKQLAPEKSTCTLSIDENH